MFSLTKAPLRALASFSSSSNLKTQVGAHLCCQSFWKEAFSRAIPKDDPNKGVGPYPKTKEERERAAKKYNLLPEDYEPFDELEGWGDYPNLPAIGGFNRDPYDDFDDVLNNRFYGEPYHMHADLYYWERIDPHEKEKRRMSDWVAFPIFCSLFVALPAIYLVMHYLKIDINNPWKQRPKMRGPFPPKVILYEFPPSPNDDAGHH